MRLAISALLLLSPLLGALPACAGPVTYSADFIEAWVVDAETRKPISDAVVVARWALEESTIVSITIRPAGNLMVMEDVTDKNGRFYLPSWGPIQHWKSSRLTYMDPEILIFKSGYEYQRLNNYGSASSEQRGGKVFSPRKSQWQGQIIELKPFKGMEEYAEHVHQLDNELEWARYGEDCEWQKIPRMLMALHRQSEQFASKGVKLKGWQIGVRIRKATDVGNQKKCGSAETFFRDFLP